MLLIAGSPRVVRLQPSRRGCAHPLAAHRGPSAQERSRRAEPRPWSSRARRRAGTGLHMPFGEVDVDAMYRHQSCTARRLPTVRVLEASAEAGGSRSLIGSPSSFTPPWQISRRASLELHPNSSEMSLGRWMGSWLMQAPPGYRRGLHAHRPSLAATANGRCERGELRRGCRSLRRRTSCRAAGPRTGGIRRRAFRGGGSRTTGRTNASRTRSTQRPLMAPKCPSHAAQAEVASGCHEPCGRIAAEISGRTRIVRRRGFALFADASLRKTPARGLIAGYFALLQFNSGGGTRTHNPAVNSRVLCQLSYPGITVRNVPINRRRARRGRCAGPGQRAPYSARHGAGHLRLRRRRRSRPRCDAARAAGS
jgi:hypothetical protein